MTITKIEFANHIRQARFRELFITEMGWNNDKTKQAIVVDDQTFNMEAVAAKSSFKIFVCRGPLPDYSTRKKIETAVTKLFYEHLIIFTDGQEQIWQLVVRQTGQPTKTVETRYHISQDPELLYQRAAGMFFTLDEEDKITIIDVTQRVSANFQQNAEKVTKQFYDKFKKEHATFLGFITGIDDKLHQDWYASLMLNRLMFCYFIQKKGFLDNNKNYLRSKLEASQAKKGQDKFYSFYRQFLLVLFHNGLGAPDHSPELKAEIGRIPYLNGGLFERHELEKLYQIEIADSAFESIFNFFDQYEWHLDTRLNATGKEINPDVIGYIFEKYINDRAQMGAYYTKEDITEYISKNCILPYLFDETKRHYPAAFAPGGEVWGQLKRSGDSYIYEAVKHGLDQKLPPEIQAGLEASEADLVAKRKAWNNPAPAEVALPTEIWREVIDRRQRYADICQKIEGGQLTQINDFITYNLNIRQFAQDVIENSRDPEFIKEFYKALTTMTILDPTCGSGAFLFAAMNILEPLYQACLQRMGNFVAEAKGKYQFFEQKLAEVHGAEHPNLAYFIYKSIILRNLHGVDIMNEAVEIAKLRLFLKLVATVEANYRKPNLGLEPLPDIDFNIRTGNTLVGFATEKELQQALTATIEARLAKDEITEKCDIVARAFTRYKEIQLGQAQDFAEFKEAKDDLNQRLNRLNEQLNQLLHGRANSLNYSQWLASHQPFHWFAEFYEIIQERGGFDVIIGNPPYVELKQISYNLNYSTKNCGNLYAPIIERYFSFISTQGKSGMIIPHSSICTDRMETLMKIFDKYGMWLSSYDVRPSKLFDGVDQRLMIYVTDFSSKEKNTSKYYRWASEYRGFLFQNVEYVRDFKSHVPNSIIKASREIERSIYNKLIKHKPLAQQMIASSSSLIYFHNAPRYFVRVMSRVPYFWGEKGGEKTSTQIKAVGFGNETNSYIVGAVLNSSLFFWWFIMFSDSRHLNLREINYFPFAIGTLSENHKRSLVALFEKLNDDFEKNKQRKNAFYKATGSIIYDEYYPKLSKHILDEIDTVLAAHYGFTAAELDFILNYDIKYRMGKELGGEEE